MNTIAAIPTQYRGIRFRSRLEAKWAAFFDRLRIDWTYEPCDMRGWIPDFRVRDVLLDVKPWATFDHTITRKLVSSGAVPVTCYVIAEQPTRHPRVRARWLGWTCEGEGLLLAYTPGSQPQTIRKTFLVEDDGGRFLMAPGFHRHHYAEVDPESFDSWIDDIDQQWAAASNATRWEPIR